MRLALGMLSEANCLRITACTSTWTRRQRLPNFLMLISAEVGQWSVVGFFPQFEMSEIFVPGDDVVKAAPPHMRRAIQPLPEPPVLGVFSCGTCGNQHTKVGCFTGEC